MAMVKHRFVLRGQRIDRTFTFDVVGYLVKLSTQMSSSSGIWTSLASSRSRIAICVRISWTRWWLGSTAMAEAFGLEFTLLGARLCSFVDFISSSILIHSPALSFSWVAPIGVLGLADRLGLGIETAVRPIRYLWQVFDQIHFDPLLLHLVGILVGGLTSGSAVHLKTSNPGGYRLPIPHLSNIA